MRFTLSLVLKVRTFGTQKWPITRQSKTCLCSRATTCKPVVAQTHENCLCLLHRVELKQTNKTKSKRTFEILWIEGRPIANKKDKIPERTDLTFFFNFMKYQIVDPVTDDLNWNKFSSDLADGIVVSILDSFVLDLPVLHFSTVQSVFDSLEKSAPQTDDQLISKPSAEKEEYFKDILIFPQPTVEKSQEKNSESEKTTAKRQRGGSPKGKHDSDGIGVMPNSDACKITDRALEHCVALNSPSIYNNQDFLQASDNVPESILYACKEKTLTERNKAGKSIVYALKEADSPTSGDHKANRVGSGTTQRAQRDGRSSGLKTIGKIFHESAEYSSLESAKSNDTTNSDPKEECNSPINVRGWDKLQKTSQEECHSPKSATSSGKTQEECHLSTHVTSNTESIANEYGNLDKCLLADVRTEKASNVEDPMAKNTSSD